MKVIVIGDNTFQVERSRSNVVQVKKGFEYEFSTLLEQDLL